MRRYYEDELRYLHEAGKEFAEAHPEQARYLNIDSVSDRDPYVERLFEGFAFLTGRIRERLDDELPEYTGALFSLLYPHFIKPIPATSIVEFKLKPGLVQETTVLEKGVEVNSVPCGDERASCRFTTASPVRLQPIYIRNAELEWHRDQTSSVRIRLELDRGIRYDALDIDSLRFYFHADAPTASAMHLFFTRHVDGISFLDGKRDQTLLSLKGQEWVRPAGFEPEEGLVPYGNHSFPGYRLLHEYLSYRRKFWFVDVCGFSRLNLGEKSDSFYLEIRFDRPYPEDKRFKTENLRLHCTPVVNLFDADAEPITVDGTAHEYRIVPSVRFPKSIESYDVKRAVGIEDASGRRHEYTPFFQFRAPSGNQKKNRHFTVSRRQGAADRPELYISFCDTSLDPLEDLPLETVSVAMECTNGSLPREKLQERMINQLAPDVPQVVQPENLNQPSLIAYPPSSERRDYFWKLLSHLSFNYLSVATRDAVVGLLDLYDWVGTEANARRKAGIRAVEWKPDETIVRGGVLRGANVTIEVQDDHFADEGDMCLFGLVMSRFFAMYASINSYAKLTIVTAPSGRTYEWNPRQGVRSVV